MTEKIAPAADAANVGTADGQGMSTDAAAVIATIQGMYAAAASWDMATARTFLAPGFYFFDLGVEYDADSILAVIERNLRAGSIYTWTVTEPRVRFAADLAWITYVNVGGVTKDSAFSAVKWLESGVLYRAPVGWKIAFMHSTRTPATPKA
jgi:hypothetical protein